MLELADEIPCTGSKLMPADVEAYLAAGGQGGGSSEEFDARPLPQSQLTLNIPTSTWHPGLHSRDGHERSRLDGFAGGPSRR